ncbi:MAG: glycosyltransferase [Bacteroidota bacterium]
MSLSFSIVVCCYNSVSRLDNTLTHLAQLDYPSHLLELLLVDNASKDDTAKFAKNKWKELGEPYAYHALYEGKAGQAYARQTGIRAAKNDFILFVDDDNWLAEDYIKIACKLLGKYPSIGVLGGKISGVFETPPPRWMTPIRPFKSLISNLAIHSDVHEYGFLNGVGAFVFGAGSFYKREVLQQLVKQRITPFISGRSQEVLISGDDEELCILMHLAGYKIYRSDQLRMQHYITSNRLIWDYFHRLYLGFGYGNGILEMYHYYIKHGEHQSPAAILDKAPIEAKIRKFNRLARLMSALPFGETFRKNKFHLLATYEKGKLKFLEDEAENISSLQAKISEYVKQLDDLPR